MKKRAPPEDPPTTLGIGSRGVRLLVSEASR